MCARALRALEVHSSHACLRMWCVAGRSGSGDSNPAVVAKKAPPDGPARDRQSGAAAWRLVRLFAATFPRATVRRRSDLTDMSMAARRARPPAEKKKAKSGSLTTCLENNLLSRMTAEDERNVDTTVMTSS